MNVSLVTLTIYPVNISYTMNDICFLNVTNQVTVMFCWQFALQTVVVTSSKGHRVQVWRSWCPTAHWKRDVASNQWMKFEGEFEKARSNGIITILHFWFHGFNLKRWQRSLILNSVKSGLSGMIFKSENDLASLIQVVFPIVGGIVGLSVSWKVRVCTQALANWLVAYKRQPGQQQWAHGATTTFNISPGNKRHIMTVIGLTAECRGLPPRDDTFVDLATRTSVLLGDKTSSHQISRGLDAARLGVLMIVLSWNLTDVSTAQLPSRLSNFTAIGQLYSYISGLRDLARSGG